MKLKSFKQSNYIEKGAQGWAIYRLIEKRARHPFCIILTFLELPIVVLFCLIWRANLFSTGNCQCERKYSCHLRQMDLMGNRETKTEHSSPVKSLSTRVTQSIKVQKVRVPSIIRT